MEQPCMHKYCPQRLAEITHDPECVGVLQAMIQANRVHVLLTGEAGSGKSALVRAIVRDYYDAAPGWESNVLFVNAIKDQGIQYYRTDVPAFCVTRTPGGRKKTVVVDDIDSIHAQNQQAFCSCIDKFGDSVHFLTSCSDAQRVIDSVQSRLTSVPVRRIAGPRLAAFLQHVCAQERLTVEPGGIEQLCAVSNDNVSVALSYVEKFRVLGEPRVDAELVRAACTNIQCADFEAYTRHVLAGELVPAIARIRALHVLGFSVIDILDAYFTFVKSTALLSEDQAYAFIECLCVSIAAFHTVHEDDIELVFLTNRLGGSCAPP